jgi:tRNA A-37 threonylcarbamoyl transferase component Bud32
VSELARIAAHVRAGEMPDGVRLLKRNRVRAVARAGDAFVKVFLTPGARELREARNLERAGRLGLPVPSLLDVGAGWIATRFLDGRAAERGDLLEILAVAERMHRSGMLHGDFHLGNLLVSDGRVVLTDLQSSRFLPYVPRVLRDRELGYLAYSLGEPLPRELEPQRFWYWVRAQRHWRSRTRRCVMESGSFTRFEAGGARGFRRRDADESALRRALEGLAGAHAIKEAEAGRLLRSGRWIVKEHRSARVARRAWRAGHGLEVRGIRTGRALAWAGRWLVMEDAGDTVTDWVEQSFQAAPDAEQEDLGLALGDLLAALHRRGIYHADLKANNIAWRPGMPPRLLDYGRVHFGYRVPLRRRIKNLAQLNAALPDVVPSRLRERGFQRYLLGCDFAGDEARLRERVVDESLRRRHRWSGC